jgi:signal transduction histidine kinase
MRGKETELRVPRKDGTIIDAAVSAAPLRDESGHVTAVMMILSDVSENKRLQRGILDVSGREQTRIGLDLHDGLGQVLSGVSFMGKALERKLADKGLEEVEDANEITRLINEAISQTRSVARSLYPVTLESDGLMAALEELAGHTENLFNISCDFTYNEQLLVDDNTVALHLYRIAQEAVNNAIRHGKARHIVISLQTGITNVLKISDDGTGFNTAEAERTGMGIDLMNYRANMIGSSIAIESTPGSGTSITCAFASDR